MKTSFLSLLLLLSAFAAVAQAQPETTPQIQEAIDKALEPPYKLAVGIRAFTLVGEYDAGLAAKYFISSRNAIEAGISKVVAQNYTYQLSLMYERHNSLTKSGGILFYYGAGAGLLHIQRQGYKGMYGETAHNTTQPGLGFIAGLEVGLGKLPLAFSTDFRGIYYKRARRNNGGYPNVANGTLGLKYRFGVKREK
jgi:hypothetical protein